MSTSPRIYLDYNATTPLDPRVRREMIAALDRFGNPSSIHAEGRHARALVDEARVSVGKLLNCDHRHLVFTSGGTEADNLAILGAARDCRARTGHHHVVTTVMEHSAVLNPCRQLEKEGFEVTWLRPTPQGLIEPDAMRQALRDDTALVSVMMANNEIGTIQPIAEMAAAAHERGALMHTDAVQAAGKVPVDVPALGVDLLSISAHKIYGPKGTGALYCAPHVGLHPVLVGGSHERGLRAGTENVAGIHGLGTAAAVFVEEGLPDLLPLRQRLETGLDATSMKILCRQSPRLPNTVNFYSDQWVGESMVMAFDLEGIAVSNGSACAAGIIEPSHVILALGYNEAVARSVIRVSLGKYSNESEIDHLLRVVRKFDSGGGC